MDNPVLKVEARVSLDAANAERKSSPFPVSSSPTDMVKDGVVQEVDARIRRTWDKTKGAELGMSNHYTSIAVLIVHWAKNLDEDLKSWKEVEELDKVFREDFDFNSKMVTLDNTSKRPQLQLSKALMDFVYEYDGPHLTNLLIVYYTGHGFTYTAKPDELMISGTEDGSLPVNNHSHAPQARWTEAERPLDDAQADTLVILDCCSASNVMKGLSDHCRSYELMAATGKDKPTASGPKSYTAALIKSLRLLRHHGPQPFTTYDLHQEIIKQRSWNTVSQLYNRRPGVRPRHIIIGPPVKASESRPQKALNYAGYLDLRIAFEDNDALEDDQVQRLCSELCKLPKSTELKICDLEFLGFTPCRDSPQFKKLVSIIRKTHLLNKAAKQFQAMIQGQAEESDSMPFEDQPPQQESVSERSASRSRTRKRKQDAGLLTPLTPANQPQKRRRNTARHGVRKKAGMPESSTLTPSASSRGATPNT